MLHERGAFAPGWGRRLRRFDAFPKSIAEARDVMTSSSTERRSAWGGLATAFALLACLWAALYEISDFVSPPLVSELGVDLGPGRFDFFGFGRGFAQLGFGSSLNGLGLNGKNQGGIQVPINLRMVFSGLPCSLVEIDVADRLQGTDSGVENGLEKVDYTEGAMNLALSSIVSRGGRAGWDLQTATWARMQKGAQAAQQLASGEQPMCKPCYDGTSACCNSCQELRVSFSRRGKDPSEASVYEQCQSQAACLVSGKLVVSKVRGNFHVGVGGSHAAAANQPHHHHWDRSSRSAGFNVSHYISHLSFGPDIPRRENPLDGAGFIQETAAEQVQYFLQVVPVDFVDHRHQKTQSYKYAMTRHTTRIDVNQPTRLPGVFFKYDFDAMKIITRPQERSWARFFTRLFGVVGGLWVSIGFCFGGVARLAEAAKKLD